MQVAWLLLAHLMAANAASGVVEVDLVFPRNDTYTPTSAFPFIFAFQNSGLALSLNPGLSLIIRNLDDHQQTPKSPLFDLRWTNISSSDPYYELRVLDFDQEARWQVTWQVSWDNCTQESLDNFIAQHFTTNRTGRGMIFTTGKGGKQVDLVSATTDRNCSKNEGVAINIAATLPVPENVNWKESNGSPVCASMADTTLDPTPCHVKIDETAAASLTSVIASQSCRATRKPGDSCPEDEDTSASDRLTGGIGASLAAALGALWYLVL